MRITIKIEGEKREKRMELRNGYAVFVRS